MGHDISGSVAAGGGRGLVPVDYREQYWNELFSLKVYSLYIEKYLHYMNSRDTSINVILAVTSSTSIAAWAWWKDYPLIWGGIICASQVIQAMRPFFPFHRRAEQLKKLNLDIAEILIYAEDKMFGVANQQCADAEVHERLMDVKRKRVVAEKKAFGGDTLPQNKKMLERARAEAEEYFSTFYRRGTSS